MPQLKLKGPASLDPPLGKNKKKSRSNSVCSKLKIFSHTRPVPPFAQNSKRNLPPRRGARERNFAAFPHARNSKRDLPPRRGARERRVSCRYRLPPIITPPVFPNRPEKFVKIQPPRIRPFPVVVDNHIKQITGGASPKQP